MSKTCPKCRYTASEEETEFSPLSCPRCSCLYSALEYINAEKIRQNEQLKPWRVTRWRPKNKQRLFFGVPVALVVMFIIYQLGHFIIANNRSISNEVYRIATEEKVEAPKADLGTITRQNTPQVTPKEQAKSASSPGTKNFDATGILTVTSKKTIKVLFINHQTKEKDGPYVIKQGKPKKIQLQKGIYTAEIKYGTETTSKAITVSFLGNSGTLDL